MNAFVSAAAITADLPATQNQFQIWQGDAGARYVFSRAYDGAREDFAGAVVILTSLKQPERLLWAGDGVAFMRLRERDPDLLSSVGVFVHLLTPCPLARKQMVLDLYSQTV